MHYLGDRLKRFSFFIAWFVYLSMTSLALALVLTPQAAFKPDSLADFSGRAFGGITLEQTTDADIKRMFATGKGAIRPEGLRVEAGPDLKVDALLDGRGGQAKVVGIRLMYTNPQDRERLLGALGTGEAGFERRRYSDWSVVSYVERGVSALVVGDRVEVVVISTPARIKAMAQGLDAESTPIDDLRREWERKDQTVRVRRISLDMSTKNIRVNNEGSEERELRNFLDRRYESRYLRYGASNDGQIRATVRIDFEKVNVSLSVEGSNEIGAVSASGSGDAKFRVENDVAFYRRSSVQDAIVEALDRLEDSLISRIRSQKPPTERDERLGRFDALTNAGIR